MGNTNPESSQERHINKTCTYHINHPTLKHATLFPQRNQMVLTVPSYLDSLLKQWEQSVAQIQSMNSDFLLLPQQYDILDNKHRDNNSQSVRIIYQCYPYILLDEIKNRKSIRQNFEEDEVWYLLWVLASSAQLLSRKMFSKIGDIRPHNIVFNENGQIKIINQLSWPFEMSNTRKTSEQHLITYLSPQQVQEIQGRRQLFNGCSSLSETFSIGVTMLSILHLQDLSYLYDFREGQQLYLDLLLLKQKVDMLKELHYTNNKYNKQLPYSAYIVKIVQKLCQINNERRLSIIKVKQWLQPHKNKIVEFKEFSLGYQKELQIGRKIELTYLNKADNNYNSHQSSPAKQLKSFFQSPRSNINTGSLQQSLENVLPLNNQQYVESRKIQVNAFQKIQPYPNQIHKKQNIIQCNYMQPPSSANNSKASIFENIQVATKMKHGANTSLNSEGISKQNNKVIEKTNLPESQMINQQNSQRQPITLGRFSKNNEKNEIKHIGQILIHRQQINHPPSSHIYNRHAPIQEDDLIRQINEQLIRSKKLFPS